MDIWLDTIDLDLIEKAQEMGVLRGVTTNPSILSEARDPQARLREILATQGGPLATQVTSRVPEEMITQGKELSEISDRIIVKVLVNSAGLRAIARLKKEGIQVLGTAVVHPRQGFMAVEAGADWIAPHYSYMGEAARDHLETLLDICGNTRILLASLRNVDQVIECAKLGVHAATMKSPLFHDMIREEPEAEAVTEKFLNQWSESAVGW